MPKKIAQPKGTDQRDFGRHEVTAHFAQWDVHFDVRSLSLIHSPLLSYLCLKDLATRSAQLVAEREMMMRMPAQQSSSSSAPVVRPPVVRPPGAPTIRPPRPESPEHKKTRRGKK